MTEGKLSSGVNQQGTLKQNGVKKDWASKENNNFCSENHTEHTDSLCGQKAELSEC